MMAFAIVLIVIAFCFSQDPIVFWATVGTVLVSLIALSILVPKSNSTPNKARRHSKRIGRPTVRALFAIASGVKQAHKKSERARRLRHHNSGVRSSIIKLHRR